MTTQWKCHEDDYGVYIKKGNVCIAKTGCIKQGRLIAAAPDLLEALCDMVSDVNETSEATLEFAKKAINKAKGLTK